MSTKINFK